MGFSANQMYRTQVLPGYGTYGIRYLVFAASNGAIFCLYSGSLKIWYR